MPERSSDHVVRLSLKHRLFKLMASISFLFLLLVLAFGVRSYRTADFLVISDHQFSPGQLKGRELSFATGGGRIVLTLNARDIILTNTQSIEHAKAHYPEGLHIKWVTQRPDQIINLGWNDTPWRRLGFVALNSSSEVANYVGRLYRVAAPFWSLALLFAPLPFVRVRRALRERRRLLNGLCQKCGYDLRATLDRCPECAQPVGARLDRSPRRLFIRAGVVCLLLTATAIFIFCDWPPVRPNPLQTSLPVDPPSKVPVVTVRPGLATTAPGGPVTQMNYREIAATIDPKRTYVFAFVPSPRAQALRQNIASVQIFTRINSRWRGEIQYLRPGQPIGTKVFPTTLKLGEIRADGDDLLVTFVAADGTAQTRSAKSDLNDPTRRFLMQMTSFSGQAWDKELFPP
ncbi:MAG: hypothetical protein JWN40_817 [Phycisphaerales bacterium]|nr:hypothetical protein [Phycisphaerales bacterium]